MVYKKLLGLVFNVFNVTQFEKEIRVRIFSRKGSLFQVAIKGPLIFLARGESISYCTPPKFNKLSPSSPVDIHTICLIGGTTLNCVLAFYTSEYLLFSSRCSSILCCFHCVAPSIGHGGRPFTVIGIRERTM